MKNAITDENNVFVVIRTDISGLSLIPQRTASIVKIFAKEDQAQSYVEKATQDHAAESKTIYSTDSYFRYEKMPVEGI